MNTHSKRFYVDVILLPNSWTWGQIQILCPNWCSTRLMVVCSKMISHCALNILTNVIQAKPDFFLASKYYIYFLYVQSWVAHVQFVHMIDLINLTLNMVCAIHLIRSSFRSMGKNMKAIIQD